MPIRRVMTPLALLAIVLAALMLSSCVLVHRDFRHHRQPNRVIVVDRDHRHSVDRHIRFDDRHFRLDDRHGGRGGGGGGRGRH